MRSYRLYQHPGHDDHGPQGLIGLEPGPCLVVGDAAHAALIDMSGSGAVIGRLHKHLGDAMRYTSMVGLTHYDEAGMGADFIKDRSQMFFAPGHIQKRAQEWGPGVFDGKAMDLFTRAAGESREWLEIRRGEGGAGCRGAWNEVLAGETPPTAAWTVAI